ncbi:MAG TPA: hypothetical protein VIX86_21200 [Streptosporangiaceae bacterium]
MGIRVVAVDVGSVGPPSKFAWAAFEPPAREALMSGNDPQSAVSAVAAGLAWDGQAALLLESPQSVPVPPGQADRWRLPGRARAGEGNRAWPAGAGAGVLAADLAQGAWMLRQLAAAVPGLSATTQPDLWQARAAPLLLAEAFVPASGKPSPRSAGRDTADAEAAGLALVDILGTGAPLASSIGCSPHAPFNLLAAMALWAGLSIDPSELSQDVLVIAARPG